MFCFMLYFIITLIFAGTKHHKCEVNCSGNSATTLLFSGKLLLVQGNHCNTIITQKIYHTSSCVVHSQAGKGILFYKTNTKHTGVFILIFPIKLLLYSARLICLSNAKAYLYHEMYSQAFYFLIYLLFGRSKAIPLLFAKSVRFCCRLQ